MPSIRYSRFQSEWLDLVAATRRRGTWVMHRQALRELGELGLRSTKDLTPATVARFVAASRARPRRSDVRTDALLRCLSAACSYAARLGYLKANPFEIVEDWGLDLEPADDVARHLGLAELYRLLDHLRRRATDWRGRRLYALVSLVAYTGCRRGEALHLQASDVDLARGFVRIPRRRLKHRAKTRASAAEIPIPPPLARILADWMPRAGSAWLFPGVTRLGPWTGGPPGRKPLDELKAAAVAAGLGRVTFLMLRHSFATHAPRWGIDPIRLKQILRHTSIRTQAHYIHPDAAGLTDAVRRVNFAS